VVVRLAAVQALARWRGVAPAVIRAEWARASESASAVPRADTGPQARPLSRRALLLGAGAAAGASVLPGTVRAGAVAARKPEGTVAIVGAGLAGLTAALTLREAGVAVTVYEAARQVGGRVHSNARYWRDGQVSEWCGELINSDHQVMLHLARRFGLGILDLRSAQARGAEDAYHVLGAAYPVAEADREFQPVYSRLRRDLDAAGAATTYRRHTPAGVALDRMSVREWIESRVPGGATSRLGRLLDIAYAVEYGAPTTDQSALNLVYMLGEQPAAGRLALTGVSDERYRIAGGNDRLPRAIAARLPAGAIRLEWRLVAVGHQPDGRIGLDFETPEGLRAVRADHGILTLPFAVLRDLDLARATLDALKRRAIRELGMGRNAKLVVQLASRFWRRPGLDRAGTGAAATDRGPLVTWESSRGQPGASGLLVCYGLDEPSGALAAPVPYADADAHPHVGRVARGALEALEAVWPGIAADWAGLATLSVPLLDPNASGSYAYYRVGQYHTIGGTEGLRQRNLHFAGEHTSPQFQGFMEGAAAEGIRVARAVLADLGPARVAPRTRRR
jgi:monoamine oxidase